MSDNVIKKMQGLAEDEERLTRIVVNGCEIFFKDSEDAMRVYEALARTQPLHRSYVYVSSSDSQLKDIKEEINKLDYGARNIYYLEPSSLALNTEVYKAHNTKEEAEETRNRLIIKLRNDKTKTGT